MSADWDKIKTEWLNGGTTYGKLAKKYGISEKTIANRASNEGWKKEKGRIREEIGKETGARIVRARVEQLDRLIEVNERLITSLDKVTRQIEKRPLAYLKDKAGSMRNAESLAKAVQIAAGTQRDLYKLPTLEQDISLEKWAAEKLEKAKSAETASERVWQIVEPEEGESADG